jgi:hypothetical protein
MFDVANLWFSIRCRYPSVAVTATGSGKLHVELPMEKNGRLSNTFKHLMLGLTDCHRKRDLIGNLLLSLKRMVGSGGDNPVLDRKIVFLQPIISVAIQRSFKPLTITCHFPRRRMEVTIYNVISMD